jgi:hypothetical protein
MMMPHERDIGPSTAAPPAASAGPVPVDPPVWRWYHKFSAVLLIVLCLEIGLFLLVFPWSEYWQNNYFASLTPQWRQYWMNSYLRGAVSGLGVANLYLSLTELFRLRRFSRRR